MYRLMKFALAFALLAASAFAADSKPVTYLSGDEAVSGILYMPAGAEHAKKPLPAIVIIHEWWGLNAWVKEQAAKFADEGYVTLAIDLYRGKVADNADLAHELMRGLPRDRAIRDMRAAVALLSGLGFVNKKKIGAIGWCMGGSMAGALAENEPNLSAAVINYGGVSQDKETLTRVNAQILGLFGAKDGGIPVDDVRKWEAQLKALGKKVEVVVYPEAGHAFENPNNKRGYRADDAADAWKRQVAFFAQALK